MKLKTSLLTMAALAVGVGSAGSASALTVGYSNDSGFVFRNTNPVTPQSTNIGVHQSVANLGGDTRYQSLWWGNDNPARGQESTNGTPINTTLDATTNAVISATAAFWTTNNQGNNQPDSALKVLGLAGNVTSGGSWVPISHVFHSNQTISVESTGLLTSGIIRSLLNINGVNTPVNDVAFNFFETPNGNSAYNCPDSSGLSCDIFQFPTSGFTSLVLDIGGTDYEFSFRLGNPSPNAFIINSSSTWGNGNTCLPGNFCALTKENNVNWLTVEMRMDEIQVPEPGSLALISLGLFGVAASSRRRKSRA